MRRNSKRGHHKKKYYDDFFDSDSDDEEDNDDFFDIDEDFDDPFDDIIKKEFGFSNIERMHNRLIGKMEKEFEQLGDEEYEENFRKKKKNKEERLQKKGINNFHKFMNFEEISPGNGTVITKSYSSKIDYKDGVPHEECYQSQSINQIKDGHKISEKQEAYKNSKTGVQKAAHQRILDDKGTKQIRKRNIKTGEQEEHNIFKGIKEEELDQFNESYNDYRNKIGFQNHYKHLNSMKINKNVKKHNYIHDENHESNNNNNKQYPQLGDGKNKYYNLKKPYKKQYPK
jgi:hypothetical protein